MSGVRVLVGTRKGAFILTSDGKRERWDVSGPHFGGWEIYHVKGSPADPNRLYASQISGWFGQMIQRSNDGGKTWEPVGNKFAYDGVPGTHQWYDGTPHPWEFKRVWHLEPSLTDPDTVYAGVEDAALFRTTDGGQSWHELSGPARATAPGRTWQPGAGGMCLHTILLDPHEPRRGCSSPSRPPAPSAPTTAARRGGRSTAACSPKYIPDPTAEVGHCVHRIAMHPSRPDVLFMQKHWDVMRSDNAGELVARDQRQPADRLRLRDRRARARAGDDLRRADQERLRALPARRQAARVSQPHRRQRVGAADQRPAAARLLRQRAARRDGRRLARLVRRLFRHDRRPGVRLGRRAATPGRRSSAICRPCCRSRCRRCHDPRRCCRTHLRTLARVDGEVRARGRRARSRSARSSTRSRRAIRCCAARSATTSTQRAPAVRAVLRLRRGSVARVAGRAAARRGRAGRRAVSRSSARWPAADTAPPGLVQVWSLQRRTVPGLVADVGTRLDAPAGRRPDVNVLVPAVAIDAAWTSHPELHEIDSSRRASRRRGDLMVQHQMAPVRPHQLGLAAPRSAADQGRKRLASLCQNPPALAEAVIGIPVDENTVSGEHISVVVAIVPAGVDTVTRSD